MDPSAKNMSQRSEFFSLVSWEESTNITVHWKKHTPSLDKKCDITPHDVDTFEHLAFLGFTVKG